MCRKPIGHGLFLRCLRGDAGVDACVGIGLDFLLRMTGFVVPNGMQWSVGIFRYFRSAIRQAGDLLKQETSK